jgi:hypothetical protein
MARSRKTDTTAQIADETVETTAATTISATQEKFTIKQAAEYLDRTPQRVRNALKEGTLQGTKQTVEGTNIEVWTTTRAALDLYKEQHGDRGNIKTWVVRLTAEQVEALMPTLNELGVELEARYTYDADAAKAYRERRKAKGSESTDDDSDDEFADDDADLSEIANGGTLGQG